jgi:ribonuclease HI
MLPKSSSASLFPTTTPASGTWIFAHCDGGARGNPGPAGYGVLVQAADGAVLAELSEFLGVRTNNYAEYSGLLASLDYALANGHKRLRVTSDSELMVKQIQGKYQVKSPDLKLLYDAAKKKIAQLDGFEIVHALRHKNKDADRLANEAMDRGMNRADKNIHREPPASTTARPAARPVEAKTATTARIQPPLASGTMLRGFVKDGTVRILGSATLPEGSFVKIIPE